MFLDQEFLNWMDYSGCHIIQHNIFESLPIVSIAALRNSTGPVSNNLTICGTIISTNSSMLLPKQQSFSKHAMMVSVLQIYLLQNPNH